MTNTLIPLEGIARLEIEAIDAEHEKLVNGVNELNAAMQTGRSREYLVEVIQKLISDAKAHFVTEEALMLQHGYPDYEQHKSDHDRLLEHVIDLEQQFHGGELLLSFAIMIDLKNWATIHIERSDRPLGDFLRLNGVR